MEMKQAKLEWSSRFVFIMACVGGAVGLGNIWMFPYKAGSNGGGAFVLIYIAAVIIPAILGLVWIWSHSLVFYIGALFALLSLIAAQFIPKAPSPNQETRFSLAASSTRP